MHHPTLSSSGGIKGASFDTITLLERESGRERYEDRCVKDKIDGGGKNKNEAKHKLEKRKFNMKIPFEWNKSLRNWNGR